jgi:hypothetical protein
MILMRNVPLGAWIFASVALLGLLASVVVLAVTGSDTSELRWLILTILNATTTFASIGGAIYGGSAAVKANQAAEQTNGHLEDRLTTAVARALDERERGR